MSELKDDKKSGEKNSVSYTSLERRFHNKYQ